MRDVRCEVCGGYGYVTGHPADGCPQSTCTAAGCDGGWIR